MSKNVSDNARTMAKARARDRVRAIARSDIYVTRFGTNF